MMMFILSPDQLRLFGVRIKLDPLFSRRCGGKAAYTQ